MSIPSVSTPLNERTFGSTSASLDNTLYDLGYYTDELDDNLLKTPERWAEWLYEYKKVDVWAELQTVLQPIFPEEHEELVVVKDIAFTALCAHHVLPFLGRVHIGYVPKGG